MTTSAIGASTTNQPMQGMQGMQAPPKPNGENFAADMTKKLTEDLGLSEEQQSQLEEILEKHTQEMEESEASGTMPDASSMQSSMDALDDEISSILTDDQKSKLDEIKANRPEPPQKPGMQQTTNDQLLQTITSTNSAVINNSTTNAVDMYM